MCLSVPSRVVEIKENNTAVVEVFGARRLVSLDLLQEDIKVGDWVLVHVGFAIQKLDPDYALESLRLFEELLEEENEP
ncbi:MAG: HypC/HybG/HupF family hydrogenase formation chaperone [Aquificaceae bacterium]|jgi:hydrogenase expression/formation protein HypC|nr:HypC/HybG/HupF family hydrogenase formation chaperone [Aquificaceae bacterium]MDM7267681.1 HypC/HybG/HupF family hydrogenase formation chaperone [Aquificaceae bacterium]QWK13651.1 MAG: HypC/HybG/HupF family hydrogenase formation chaperone [Aquificota bacterium]